MKASKRHLEVAKKKGRLKELFSASKKTPGAKAMRQAILKQLRAGKSYTQAVAEVTKEHTNGRQVVGDASVGSDAQPVAHATGGDGKGGGRDI